MSKEDKKLYKFISRKIGEYIENINYTSMVPSLILGKVYQLAKVAEHYRTRIGRLKRQVQQLNKEIKLLKEVI